MSFSCRFSAKGSQAAAVFLLAASVTSLAAPLGSASPSEQDLQSLAGEWIYVEDRTEGRSLEELGTPMSSKFSFRVEDRAVILASGHGSGNRDVRVALDGTPTELQGTGQSASTFFRYTGAWKDGAFTYQTEFFRGPEKKADGSFKREFRSTQEGLVVRMERGPNVSVGLYRHPNDITMPSGFKAVIGDLAWLTGAWVGTRGATGAIAIEERWSHARGGAMLAVSRTVSRDKMSAFEFLRIVEREGSLVYIAQPNGSAPTEFVLTELTGKRAVFENPRHDYPKKIQYELSDSGGLTATIGFSRGGTPQKFEFKREQS